VLCIAAASTQVPEGFLEFPKLSALERDRGCKVHDVKSELLADFSCSPMHSKPCGKMGASFKESPKFHVAIP